MVQKGLEGFFEEFGKAESLFLNRHSIQLSFQPGVILHREHQINFIAGVLAPPLSGYKASNLFIYGKPGTGKTLVVKHISIELMKAAQKHHRVNLRIIYINCKLRRVADTEYRVIAQLARELGKDIPSTGLPTDEVYRLFYGAVDEKECMLIIVLDEIDELVNKVGDEILYNLTRINEELAKSTVSIIGISNNLMFIDAVDPRVRSSLSEEEVLFTPYNALELLDILTSRSKEAFKSNVVEEGVLQKCAAYAAREHGDARRALELLRVAAEIAERNHYPKLSLTHIDEAQSKIEKDRVMEILGSQPDQSKLTLFAILTILKERPGKIFTGEVYELYTSLCEKVSLRPLTQRRISDIIGELDLLGIINARVVSKGRYGRTREITLIVPSVTISKMTALLRSSLDL